MKTQLLEDIGENAALPPAPFNKVGNSKADKQVPGLAPAAPRPAAGVREHKPAVAPIVPPHELDPPLTPLELDSVFDEIAALEAQYVAPGGPPAPVTAPAEPGHALPAAPAGPKPPPQPAQAAAVPPEPVFEFTPPAPAPAAQAADPFERVLAQPALPVRPAEPTPVLNQKQAAAVPPKPLLAPEPVFDFAPAAPAAPAAQAAAPFQRVPAQHALPIRPAEAPPDPDPDPEHGAAGQLDPRFDFTLPPPAPQPADSFGRAPVGDAPAPRAAEPPHRPVLPTGPTPAPEPSPGAAAPPDPVFDFTPPPPPDVPPADPFTRPSGGFARPRQRYLVWAACVLAALLLILGGGWVYQERSTAGSLALIASESQQAPEGGKAVQAPAPTAKESTAPVAEDAAAAPAAPAGRAAAGGPPLVLLEPDSSTTAKPAQAVPAAAGQAATRPVPQAAPQPEPAAEQAAAAPPPKPAAKKPEREPVRQAARASAAATESPAEADTSMTALLKACRQHGYDAAQCVKRACSLTKYGFACRGR